MPAVRKPRTGEEGIIAIILALALSVLIIGAGLAIDSGRAYSARSSLQTTLDAAVIAAAAQTSTTDAKLLETVNSFIGANPPGQGLTIKSTAVTYTQATEQVKVTLTAEMATSFMAIAGVTKMTMTVSSEARRPTPPPLELALVLDTTASMSTVVGTQTKLKSLQSAATTLINNIMVNENVKVGIVPFGQYVRVDQVNDRTASWLWFDASLEKSIPKCAYENAQTCTLVDAICDGAPCKKSVCVDDLNKPAVRVCDAAKYGSTLIYWQGCIGSRTESLRGSNAGLVNARTKGDYPAVVPSEATPCAPQMLGLTNVKANVLTVINNLFTVGETFIPQGLLWGWNVLTSEAPFTQGQTKSQLQGLGGKKALVLMTDGLNTLAPWKKDPTVVDNSGHLPIASGPYATDPGYTDRLTTTLCTNIKSDGVEIYTVMFNVTDANLKTLLENCATDKTKAFDAANTAELTQSFEKIGKQLMYLRLVQ